MSRPDGYYWVQIGRKPEWEEAKYEDGLWSFSDVPGLYADADMVQIGERIAFPEKETREYIAKLETAILDLYDGGIKDWDGVSSQSDVIVEMLRIRRDPSMIGLNAQGERL